VRFRPDGVEVLDVREVSVRSSACVKGQTGRCQIPAAGFALPFPGVLLAPGSVALSKEDPQCG
jgi:hypothetical protein